MAGASSSARTATKEDGMGRSAVSSATLGGSGGFGRSLDCGGGWARVAHSPARLVRGGHVLTKGECG